MIEYKVKGCRILKDGHTMFNEDIAKELNRKAYLEDRVKLLEMAVQVKRATISCKDELLRSLLAYDSWAGHENELSSFVTKYAGKDVDIFEDANDFFILCDNNVPMPADSFTFK